MALSALAPPRALLKIGAQPVASFDEGTAEAEVAANLYPGIRDAMLSAHPWSFATAQAALGRLSAVPRAEFGHAFQLPAGFLRALSAGTAGRARGIVYRLQEDRLFTDAEAVALTYVFRPDASAFPPYFAAALAARLAAEFCIPLTENSSRAEMLYRLGRVRAARGAPADSQQATARVLEGFSPDRCAGLRHAASSVRRPASRRGTRAGGCSPRRLPPSRMARAACATCSSPDRGRDAPAGAAHVTPCRASAAWFPRVHHRADLSDGADEAAPIYQAMRWCGAGGPGRRRCGTRRATPECRHAAAGASGDVPHG